jgi:hypothetical protein
MDAVARSPLAVSESHAGVAPAADKEIALRLHRLAGGCAIGLVVLADLLVGLQLRFLAFRASERVHYQPDIDNAFVKGTTVLREGFLNAYDNEYAVNGKTGLYDLDYAPARLGIATLWTRWVRTQVDGRPADWRLIADWPADFYQRARQLKRTYQLCRPLLWFNDAMEIAGAAGVFALVRRWTIAHSGTSRATALALLASLFFWFNPALIWDAHCWPQWDCWLLPFFLWALVAASDDHWFTAGALIGAATLFKAQILLGAPLLILWPLMLRQPLAAARCMCGFAVVVAVAVSPWLVRVDHSTSIAAIAWVGSVAAVGGTAAVLRGGFTNLGRHLIAASVAAALLVSPLLFGGSFAWMRVGMFGGGQSTVTMSLGPNPNLATLLESQYGWEVMDPVLTLPAGRASRLVGLLAATLDRHFSYVPGAAVGIPVKWVLGAAYAMLLVVCAAAAAMHASRQSPRFLLAVTTPWVLMYALLPHMHERYMVWGVAIGAVTIVLSPGWALLNMFLTLVALGTMIIATGSTTFHHMRVVRWFDGWTPGVGWAVLLAAAVMLYGALTPPSRALVTASAPL